MEDIGNYGYTLFRTQPKGGKETGAMRYQKVAHCTRLG